MHRVPQLQLILWWKLPITSILDVFDAHSALYILYIYIYTGLWGSINAGTPIAEWFMNKTQLKCMIWDFRNPHTTCIYPQQHSEWRDRSCVVQPPEPRARACCLLQVCLMQPGVGVGSRVALMGLEKAMFGCFMLIPRGWQQLEDPNHCPGVTE
jgi:hypothetical protein